MSRRYHLVGVGGVGMSALAEALVLNGASVTGSDRHIDQGRGDLPVFKTLQAIGVGLVPQDGSGIHCRLDAVVYSTAVEAKNPERMAAVQHALPLLHRSEMLAQLVQSGRCLAVAGTSGKTTVTAMLGWALEAAGLDPWVLNGGALLGWSREQRTGHVRRGAGDLWVIEADESDRSLLRFAPEWAVLTTVSADHFELADTISLFNRFADRVRGPVVTTRDVRRHLGARSAWRIADARGFAPRPDGTGSRFRYAGMEWRLPVPGVHNAMNARLTAAMCRCLGADLSRARDALAEFPGIHRRLECVQTEPVRILDDVAHNPEKIRAAWAAAAAGGGRILGVWRPHGFGPLRHMMEDLKGAFAEICRPADRLYLLPVYYAGGTAQADVTSADLASALAVQGVAACAVRGYEDLERRLKRGMRTGDTVLVMGARDPDLPVFARRLKHRPS